MLKDVIDLTNSKALGLNTSPNLFNLEKGQSPNVMNVQALVDGSWMKRLGTNTMNSTIIADSAATGFSPAGTLVTNLQAFWNMNEASGDRKDSFGGHLLLDNNTVLQSGGINKQAALFVSSNSEYLLHANTSTLATGDFDFSLSSWIYLNSTSTTLQRTIVSKKDNADNPDTVLLLHLNSSNFADESINTKTVTANSNAVIETSQSKFGGASCHFVETSGAFLSVPDSVDFFVGASDMTIDFWLRYDSLPGAGAQSAGFGGQQQNTQNFWGIRHDGATISYEQVSNNTTISSVVANWTASVNTWYHIAFVKSGTSFRVFVDGSELGYSTGTTDADPINNYNGEFWIGRAAAYDTLSLLDGWIDEYRMIKGTAVWKDNFVSPTSAYSTPSNPREYEYWLFVDTDNVVNFSVSSSGTATNGNVRATSFGALTTSTWYNVVAYHDTNDLLAVGVNLSMNSSAYTSGVRSGSAPFVVGAVSNGASNFFDGRIDETGFWKRTLGTTDRSNLYNSGAANTYQQAFGRDPWASFDFGAGSVGTRWLTVAAATGIYASSNLGVTWVNIATDRTANYQYFERSKNILVSGSDAYDSPLFWSGSSNTFMAILNTSAPLVKYFINHLGFLIGLNSSTRKRGFYWEDENSQLTGDWGDSFDIPSSSDDEVTGGFILRRRLYVSTRYFLYGVDYIGGNPDWQYRKIKDFGFIPRTMKVVPVEIGGETGEVAIGMDWGNKIRIFDGSEHRIISGPVEFDNKICDFALDKVSNSGSGRIVSFAEVDRKNNIYRICLSIGANSTQTTHFLNYSGRINSFWPDDNRPFNTMTWAESNNTSYMMAFDRSGRCHMLDSGNLDANVTAIQDVLDIQYLYDKSPSQSQKNHSLDLYFLNNTAGRIYIKESVNFDKNFSDRDNFVISGTGSKGVLVKNIDVPSETNSYQVRITTSGGTNDPYQLLRYDFFTEGLGIGKTE